MKKRAKEDVFSEIRRIHGDKIDLTHADYINTHSRMLVKCNQCGYEWYAIPQSLLNGCGCRKCASIERGRKERIKLNKEELINRAKSNLKIHNDYDYSLIPDKEYELTSEEIVQVVCPHHGIFDISVRKLLMGTGCPKCYNEFLKNNQKMPEGVFRKRLYELNPDLDYNASDYVNTQTKLEFTCKVCGHKFYRKPNGILSQTYSCPECNKKVISSQRTKTTEQYIEDVKKVWGDKYGTDHIVYIASDKPVTPTCLEHGDFSIEANSFLQGHGCPYHYNVFSKQELEILDFIRNDCGFNKARRDRKILGSRNEIDILVEEKNVGFEYDGLFWHNELHKEVNSHLDKTNACKDKRITLYHIFEDEWLYKKDIVKSMIANILGCTFNTIYARKCYIKEITSRECSEFLINNHIQGNCLGKIRIGLFYNDNLVSVMLLGHARHFAGSGKQQWELLRMCSKLNYKVVGGASKMFKYFLNTYKPQEVITFADKRWSTGNVYNKLGFMLYNESKPNYYYVIGDKRFYRYNFRKSILKQKYGCPDDMTEREFCKSQKWYRIYDCGCLCYKFVNKT